MELALATDLYQLTMMQGYFRAGQHRREAVFDLFFRELPWGNGFAIWCGLEQAADYVERLRFQADDIAYLRSLGRFDPDFLEALASFRFTGDIAAIPEGSVVFPHEPLLRVRAPIWEAQLLETTLLAILNHQTLIATKAARVVQAAGGDEVLEFGLRRAQGLESGLWGTRAAMIGGCAATSNVLAGKRLGVPVRGTHSHSWVMAFPSELDAFRAYAQAAPEACVLLVDTYDTLRSGVPNAIQVARELEQAGHRLAAIRLDSGDLAYLSQDARRQLDDAGLSYVRIIGSGDLDEDAIADLKAQGARIDVWGVGTRLITGWGQPALGGVYKLAAIGPVEGAGQVPTERPHGSAAPHMGRVPHLSPVLKASDTAEKTTNPGVKQVYRFYDRRAGIALADLIALADEPIPEAGPFEIFDPVHTWKRKTLKEYVVWPLLTPLFAGGRRVAPSPGLEAIRQRVRGELARLWPEYRRLRNPKRYIVDLSYELWQLKDRLLRAVTHGARRMEVPRPE